MRKFGKFGCLVFLVFVWFGMTVLWCESSRYQISSRDDYMNGIIFVVVGGIFVSLGIVVADMIVITKFLNTYYGRIMPNQVCACLLKTFVFITFSLTTGIIFVTDVYLNLNADLVMASFNDPSKTNPPIMVTNCSNFDRQEVTETTMFVRFGPGDWAHWRLHYPDYRSQVLGAVTVGSQQISYIILRLQYFGPQASPCNEYEWYVICFSDAHTFFSTLDYIRFCGSEMKMYEMWLRPYDRRGIPMYEFSSPYSMTRVLDRMRIQTTQAFRVFEINAPGPDRFQMDAEDARYEAWRVRGISYVLSFFAYIAVSMLEFYW